MMQVGDASLDELVARAVEISGVVTPLLVLMGPNEKMVLVSQDRNRGLSELGIGERAVIVVHGTKTLAQVVRPRLLEGSVPSTQC
jgi:hypothetical protein